MDRLHKATHEGKLNIGDTELNCAVLEDGTRVITASAIFKAFGRTKRGRGKEIRVPNMPSFIDANNLQPFISNDLRQVLNQIEFTEKNGKNQSTGYSALILPMLCKVYLDARQAKVLKIQQLPLARASEVLLLGLANIGIIALVDEATGYQYDREKDELQKILNAYISAELLPWQKRFPDEFYKEIFRLNGWDFTVSGIKKRPGVIGTWTKKLIYNLLPKGVLKELESRTPVSAAGNKTARLHQSLTLDIGEPHLEKQLISVITLMNVSKNWDEFLRLFGKKFYKELIELPVSSSSKKELGLPKGRQTTIFDMFSEANLETPTDQVETEQLSEFDKKLKGLLSVPPPKKNESI